MKWNAFFSKQFWRIYPPCLLILSFFINRIDISKSGLINFFSHVFLLRNLNNETFFAINDGLWSIALEVQLYFIYPIYIGFIKYIGSTKTTIFLLLITVTFCIVGYLYNNLNKLPFNTFVLKFWFTWATGSFLADRYHQDKRLFKKPVLWFSVFYILLFVFKLFHSSSAFILIPATLSCLALMEVILYGNFIDKYPISKSIFKWLSYIGLISYSVYLIHQPYLNDLLNLYNPRTSFPHINDFVRVASTYLTIFLISFSIYKIIELKSIECGKYIREK